MKAQSRCDIAFRGILVFVQKSNSKLIKAILAETWCYGYTPFKLRNAASDSVDPLFMAVLHHKYLLLFCKLSLTWKL